MHLTWGNVIAMLTDFGTKDEFVGTMKGVIACIAPSVNVVDITHDVTPYAVAEAAFRLAASYCYFPRGSVFLAVVDPGVGTNRRAISLETTQYRFVAPDNGLLWFIIDSETVIECRELSNTRFHLGDKPELHIPWQRHLRACCGTSGKRCSRIHARPETRSWYAHKTSDYPEQRHRRSNDAAGSAGRPIWKHRDKRRFPAIPCLGRSEQALFSSSPGHQDNPGEAGDYLRRRPPWRALFDREQQWHARAEAVNQGSAVDDLGLSAMNYRNTQITLKRLPQ